MDKFQILFTKFLHLFTYLLTFLRIPLTFRFHDTPREDKWNKLEIDFQVWYRQVSAYQSQYQANQHQTWRPNTGHRGCSDRGGHRCRHPLRRLELWLILVLTNEIRYEGTQGEDVRNRWKEQPLQFVRWNRFDTFVLDNYRLPSIIDPRRSRKNRSKNVQKRRMENNEDVSGTCKINVTNDAKFIVWKKKNKFCSLRTFFSREIENFCKLIGVYD